MFFVFFPVAQPFILHSCYCFYQCWSHDDWSFTPDSPPPHFQQSSLTLFYRSFLWLYPTAISISFWPLPFTLDFSWSTPRCFALIYTSQVIVPLTFSTIHPSSSVFIFLFIQFGSHSIITISFLQAPWTYFFLSPFIFPIWKSPNLVVITLRIISFETSFLHPYWIIPISLPTYLI